MKTERKILIAFLLNFFFAIFEGIGGALIGSVAIISDSVHDVGDALSIGLAYFLEKKSHRRPDEVYTFGYARYSVLAGLLTTSVLSAGSLIVIYHAIVRLFHPVVLNEQWMTLFAIFGLGMNLVAAWMTHDGHSLNQKAVNLHMLEDVLGWLIVLVGAIFIRLTGWTQIDPLLSIAVACFILYNAFLKMKEILAIFLEKSPVDIREIQEALIELPEIESTHHIHLWTMDGEQRLASLHLVYREGADSKALKEQVRQLLHHKGINHVTLELETTEQTCTEQTCRLAENESGGGHALHAHGHSQHGHTHVEQSPQHKHSEKHHHTHV